VRSEGPRGGVEGLLRNKCTFRGAGFKGGKWDLVGFIGNHPRGSHLQVGLGGQRETIC